MQVEFRSPESLQAVPKRGVHNAIHHKAARDHNDDGEVVVSRGKRKPKSGYGIPLKPSLPPVIAPSSPALVLTTPKTNCPMARVINRKYTLGHPECYKAKDAGGQQSRDKTGRGRYPEKLVISNLVMSIPSISTNPEKSRVPEGREPRISDKKIQAHHKETENEDLRRQAHWAKSAKAGMSRETIRGKNEE